jgi:hypothetical protein
MQRQIAQHFDMTVTGSQIQNNSAVTATLAPAGS